MDVPVKSQRRSGAAWLGAGIVIASLLAVPALAGEAADMKSEAAGSASSSYVLGPSDKLRIVFYGEEQLNIQPEYTVSATGKINLPLVGDIQAAGLSVQDLQSEITKTYANGYLADPKFSLQVATSRPFYILGEVKTPGQYSFSPGLTVLNAVAMAGGFTYRAVKDEVKIRHVTDKMARKYALEGDTPVLPGDTIEIRERWF